MSSSLKATSGRVLPAPTRRRGGECRQALARNEAIVFPNRDGGEGRQRMEEREETRGDGPWPIAECVIPWGG